MRDTWTGARHEGDGSPGLRQGGERSARGRRVARSLAGVTGLAFLVMGVRRRDRLGVVLGSVGAGLLVAGLTGHAPDPRAVLPRLRHHGGVPVDRLFEFWSPYEEGHDHAGRRARAARATAAVPPYSEPPPYSQDSVHAH